MDGAIEPQIGGFSFKTEFLLRTPIRMGIQCASLPAEAARWRVDRENEGGMEPG